MAQESLFSENWCSASAGSRAKIRNIMSALLFSCDQVGVDREESNHECSPERETAESPDVLTPEEIMAFLKELPDPLRTMIELDAFTGLRRGRTDRASVAGRGFREFSSCISVDLWWQMVEGAPKTEASSKRRSLDAQTAESSLGMEAPFSIRKSRRLVVCLSAHERPTALLAGTLWRYYGKPALERARVTKQVSYHTFRHTFGRFLKRERRKSEGRTGVAAPRES